MPSTAAGFVVGAAFYAMQGFTSQQCTTALKAFDGVKHPAVSILWGTFGKSTTCLKRFINKAGSKPHTIEIHFSNETCRRGERICERGREVAAHLKAGAYNYGIAKNQKQVIKAIETRARDITQALNPIVKPHTQIIISTGLEDNYTNPVYRKVYRLIKANIPTSWAIARSHVYAGGVGAYIGSANFVELHHVERRAEERRACVYCNDGWDIDFKNGYRRLNDAISISKMRDSIRRGKKRCRYNFIWWAAAQGNTGRFVVPSRRSFSVRGQDVYHVNKLIRSF